MNDQALLNSIQIAAPCSVDWNSMSGDERIRFCQQCKLNVYNISEMSKKEAVELIRKSEGRTCIRMYKRCDGTVITDNCPVGLRRLRDKTRAIIAAAVAALAWITMPGRSEAKRATDAILGKPAASAPLPNHPEVLQGEAVAAPVPAHSSTCVTQGAIAPGVPLCPPPDRSENVFMKLAIIIFAIASAAGGVFVAIRRRRASLWMLGSIMGAVLLVAGFVWGMTSFGL
ncbi:MAG TPA: hypothetical protein V6D17_09780 [Candidatus Obscuribacterales bacterium]